MKKPGDSNTDVSFGVLVEFFFHLAWCQIFQCSMRPFGIIKLNIESGTGLKCSIGSNIISSLQYLKRLLIVFLIHIKSFAANLDAQGIT